MHPVFETTDDTFERDFPQADPSVVLDFNVPEPKERFWQRPPRRFNSLFSDCAAVCSNGTDRNRFPFGVVNRRRAGEWCRRAGAGAES